MYFSEIEYFKNNLSEIYESERKCDIPSRQIVSLPDMEMSTPQNTEDSQNSEKNTEQRGLTEQ